MNAVEELTREIARVSRLRTQVAMLAALNDLSRRALGMELLDPEATGVPLMGVCIDNACRAIGDGDVVMVLKALGDLRRFQEK